MAGQPYAAGGIRTTVAATRAATDEQLTGHVGAAGRGDAAPGHDHGRDQERLRPHRPRRGAQPRGRAAVHRGDDVPRRPRRARRYATPRGVRRRWSPARCWRRARRTPAGSTCSARPAPSTPTRPAPSSPPVPRRACGAGCTPTSSAPVPGVRLACELGLAAVDHCTYLTDADVAALAESGTVATLLPGVEFSTRQPYPDARRAARRRRAGRAGHRLQPRLVLHLLAPVLRRAGGPRDGDDAGRGACTPRRPGAPRRSTATTSGVLAPGRRADLAVLDAPSYLHLAYRPGVPLVTATWLAGRPL